MTSGLDDSHESLRRRGTLVGLAALTALICAVYWRSLSFPFVFDDYDTPTFKTVNHIATTPIGRSAWFKDPDGNTIAVFQPE